MDQVIPNLTGETVTNMTAAVAAASPWWLPYLEQSSQAASLWLPILGATWLLVQLVLKLEQRFRKRP